MAATEQHAKRPAIQALADYDRMLAEGDGNPAPVDAMALMFRDGRACVYVRLHGSDTWREVMSAPGTTPDGLACGIDCRQSNAIATAPFATASSEGHHQPQCSDKER